MMRTSVLGVVLVLSCASLAACNQQHTGKREAVHEREGANTERGAERGTERERHGGLRRICAADLDKYCAGQARGRERRTCLQEHMDQLSADCKAAVQARGERRRKRDL